MNFEPYTSEENDKRNAILFGLNHEDIVEMLAGKPCANGCSTCDTSAYYVVLIKDDGPDLFGHVECLRAATLTERLIAEDMASNTPYGKSNSITRIPTRRAAQRHAAGHRLVNLSGAAPHAGADAEGLQQPPTPKGDAMITNEDGTVTYRFIIEVTLPADEDVDADYVSRQVEKMIENNSDWTAYVN